MKLMNWLVSFLRNYSDIAISLAFLLGVIHVLAYDIFILAYPNNKMLFMWLLLLNTFIVLFGLALPIFWAGREARRRNAFNDLLVQTIWQIAKMKEGLEPNHLYNVGEVYCLDDPDTQKLKQLVEAVLGDNYQITIDSQYGSTRYAVKLKKLGNLAQVTSELPKELCV